MPHQLTQAEQERLNRSKLPVVLPSKIAADIERAEHMTVDDLWNALQVYRRRKSRIDGFEAVKAAETKIKTRRGWPASHAIPGK